MLPDQLLQVLTMLWPISLHSKASAFGGSLEHTNLSAQDLGR